MKGGYFFLNVGIVFWSLALFAHFIDRTEYAALFGVLTLIALTIFQLKQQGIIMFKRKNVPQSTNCTSSSPVDCMQEKTVIAAGALFDGKLISLCDVYVYGEIHGDITASGYSVNIMSDGIIHGDISCETLIVNGIVVGKCQAETVDILENGNVNGALVYSKLSIQKNGIFTGNADICVKSITEITSTIVQPD